MKNFSYENLLSVLFALGFDQVDYMLYTAVLNKIYIDQVKKKQFEFIEEKFTDEFNNIIECNEIGFKLKDECSIMPIFNKSIVNKELLEYLNTLDFKEIIIDKINLIGTNNFTKYPMLFSNKEKGIISDLFGIDKINKTLIKTKPCN